MVNKTPLPAVLSAGAHLSPEEGASLMEVVSVAPGQPWSDEPACTHPLVAHLARLVNDTLSDSARRDLLPLVPLLSVASNEDPRTYAQVAHTCTGYALARAVKPPFLLAHLHRVAEAQLADTNRRAIADGRSPGRRAGMPAALFRRGPAYRGLESSVLACTRLPADDRDVVLLELLRRALVEVTPGAGVGGTREWSGGHDSVSAVT